MGSMISWGAWEGAVTGQEGNGERVLLVEGEQQQAGGEPSLDPKLPTVSFLAPQPGQGSL